MHGTIKREPLNGAIQFANVEDAVLAIFGAPDHDWHVMRWRIWLKDMARTYGVHPWERAQILAAVRAAKEAA